MREHSVYIQSLYDLVISKKKVNPWELVSAAEGMYRSVKVVGIDNTYVHYQDESETTVELAGKDIPIRIKAMAIFIVTLIYRWNDTNSGRLELHFGLPTSIYNILSDTKIFKNNNAGIACINVQEVIEAYLSSK